MRTTTAVQSGLLPILSLVVASAALAQTGAAAKPPAGISGDPSDIRPPATAVAPAQVTGGPDYRIGPGDQLWINVLQAPELAATIRVSQQGAISLPLIGTVTAGGLTTLELKHAIEERLERKYIKEPDVTVQVTDAPSHSVSVIGAVQKPGLIQVPGTSTLVQVISLAGGLAADAGESIIVMHKGGDGAGSGTQELKINPLMGSRDSAMNVPIYPGDVIKVSPADVVYVVGAVNKPGAYPMQGNARVTAVRAIALGQGLAPAAAETGARVVRTGPHGERLEIPVNLKAVLKGKAPDVPLQAHDVLFVPISGGKVAGQQVLDAFMHLFAFRPGW